MIDISALRLRAVFLAIFLGLGALASGPAAASPTLYGQVNLVSDLNAAGLSLLGYKPAAQQDSQLINPWGISHNATSPFWLSDAGTSLSTVYSASTGVKNVGLTTTIPGPPSGTVVGGGQFTLGGAAVNFMFATLNGRIAARVGAATVASIAADNSVSGAVYTGLALSGTTAANSFLYAANFSQGTIDVFNSTFQPVASNFIDPNLPAGYTPFNVQTLNGRLYVTYTRIDPVTHKGTTLASTGIVDEFDFNGTLISRIAAEGLLNSPWGVTIAPANFGQYSNALLVGNFGDGHINAYDPNGGGLLGTLLNDLGNPLAIDGLWALSNGTGTPNGGDINSVYFAAGIGNEEHGLFGRIFATPEPGSLALLGGGLAAFGLARRRRRMAIA